MDIILKAGKGISIDPLKVEAIKNWKISDLTNRRAVRLFVGLCNYVRIFCHYTSEVAEPFNRLLKKDVEFKIVPEQSKSFEKMKQLAIEAPVMAIFYPGRPIKVEYNASRNATGGIIWQQ